MQLLDVYRLASRIYPDNSDERRMYFWLERRLAENRLRADTPPLQEILEGGIGPPVEVPLPEDWRHQVHTAACQSSSD